MYGSRHALTSRLKSRLFDAQPAAFYQPQAGAVSNNAINPPLIDRLPFDFFFCQNHRHAQRTLCAHHPFDEPDLFIQHLVMKKQ